MARKNPKKTPNPERRQQRRRAAADEPTQLPFFARLWDIIFRARNPDGSPCWNPDGTRRIPENDWTRKKMFVQNDGLEWWYTKTVSRARVRGIHITDAAPRLTSFGSSRGP